MGSRLPSGALRLCHIRCALERANWTIVASPNPPRAQSSLNAVTAVSPTDVWAVGSYSSAATNFQNRTLIEHWDGSTWRIVPSPNPGNVEDALYAVTAISTNDVWAVGDVQSSNGNSGLTVHWDGSAWTAVFPPEPGRHWRTPSDRSGGTFQQRRMGGRVIYSRGFRKPVSQHWNGMRWIPASTPEPGPGAELHAVTAAGGTIWAVGAYTQTEVSYAGLLNPRTFILRR